MSKLIEQVRSYNDGTSIHGLKYITEDGRHIVEHILWGLLFSGAVGLMIMFVIPGKKGKLQKFTKIQILMCVLKKFFAKKKILILIIIFIFEFL